LDEYFAGEPVQQLLARGARVDLLHDGRRSPLDYAKKLKAMVDGWAPQDLLRWSTERDGLVNNVASSGHEEALSPAEREILLTFLALQDKVRKMVDALQTASLQQQAGGPETMG